MDRRTLGLRTAGFRAYLATQFLGAFNDNAFKFLLLSLITTWAAGDLVEEGLLKMKAQAYFAFPFILLAGWAGALADRYRKSAIFVGAKLTEVLLMASVVAAFVLLAGGAQLEVLLGLLFLMGAQSTFFGPAKYGYLAEMVEERELSRANGLVSMTTFVAIIMGQIVGPAIFDAFPGRLELGALALVGFALLGTITALFIPRAEAAHPKGELLNPFPGLIRTGREVAANPNLLYTVLGIGHFYLLAALLQILLFSYAETVLGSSKTGAGAFVAITLAGIAAGSLLAVRWSERKVELGLVPLGALGMSVFLFVLSSVPTPAVAAEGEVAGLFTWLFASLSVFGLGLAGGLFIVPLNANLQILAPETAKGRFMAFGNMVSFVGIFLSAGVLGLLGLLELGARQQALAVAIFTVLGTAVSLWMLPEAFLRLCAWLLAHSIYRIRVLHSERIPATGGALLVANHVSWVDWLVIAATSRRRVRFLIYRHYFDWWPVHWLFKLAGCVPIASGDAPEVVQASLEEAAAQIEAGNLVVIFAEGTVTRTGHLQSIRRGYQRIAQGRGIPIIPVHLDGLWGSVFSHEGGRLLMKLPRRIPYPVTVTYGEPLPPRAEPWQLRAAIQRLSTEAWVDRKRGRLPLHVTLLREERRTMRGALYEKGREPLSRAETIAWALTMRDLLVNRLGHGRRVGIMLTHGQLAVIAQLAVLYAGRVPVPLNMSLAPEELSDMLRRANVDTVLTDDTHRPLAESTGVPHCLDADLRDAPRAKRRVRRWRILNWLVPSPLAEWLAVDGERRDMDAPAVLLYSAGSTGVPKGILLSHHNILSNIESVQEVLDLDEKDRLVGLLPFFMAAGVVQMLWRPLLTETDVTYVADPLDARAVGNAVAHDRATVMFATPRLLERYLRSVRPDRFGSLRLVFCAGEKLLPLLRVAFDERFGLEPFEAYSSTECSSLVAMNTPDVRGAGVFQRGARGGTVGHPLPGVTVEIEDPETGDLLGNDQPGMLRIRGPGVFAGYLDEPQPARDVLDDGFYVSGDMASMDEAGFLTFTGRYARVTRIGGERVSHSALEEAIAYQLGVPDNPVAVVGHADDGHGESLWVFYQRGTLVPEHVVRGLSRTGLTAPWLPDAERFVPVEEIPLLPTGIVDYRELRRMLGRSRSSDPDAHPLV
ncbi:MAG: MFS transporter [Planctomycetota bacterium]|jgi:acyl-[acyl-carrier-protein]-phospholipid O-acyltransferase/long-chain-fatty-acid--[acyl-carrier-protein] ligase